MGVPSRGTGCGCPRSEARGEPGVNTRLPTFPVGAQHTVLGSPGTASAQAALTVKERVCPPILKKCAICPEFPGYLNTLSSIYHSFPDRRLTPHFTFRGS